jgi:hypothetical protein
MRSRFLVLLTGLALSAALLAPTGVLATETETIHFSDTDVEADVNPCSGATGTLTFAFSGVVHTTALDNGTFHETSTVQGTFTFVPDDPSQPTYSGHATFWDGENENSKNFTATFTGNIVLRGSDGSRITDHARFHITVNANGTVTSFIDAERLTCP